jgi:hypothetical protein
LEKPEKGLSRSSESRNNPTKGTHLLSPAPANKQVEAEEAACPLEPAPDATDHPQRKEMGLKGGVVWGPRATH